MRWGISITEPWKEARSCRLCEGTSSGGRILPGKTEKVRFPSEHSWFPNCRDAGMAKPHTKVPQKVPALTADAQRHKAPIGCLLPVSWWGATVMSFCISSALPQFCSLLKKCPLLWPHRKGATGCSRGALLEVNNLYPLQEPAWATTRVVVADPQFLQLAQVDGFDGEHVHLHRRQEASDCSSQKGKRRGRSQGNFFPTTIKGACKSSLYS